ncbi:MAG: AmmeMemoRadiSam system protein B [Magnetococcales bacterium]|nr:AmmeMemoRadiSam system protein B [Magnetococcales bacterium]
MKKTLSASLIALIFYLGAISDNLAWMPRYPGTLQASGKSVRPSPIAGSWYPGEPKKLNSYLDRMIHEAEPEALAPEAGKIRALILPHAGYRYSGATAAAGIKHLSGQSFKRVVVVGPGHRFGFKGFSTPQVTHYQTPLGEIPLDREAQQQLLSHPLFNAIPQAHQREHSIEMTLPLLQKTLSKGWKLLPILVGRVSAKGYAEAALQLKPLLDEETLLIISGDFTHYGPNYDFLPFPKDDQVAQNIRKLDMGAWEQIVARDPDGFQNHRRESQITACAHGPVMLLLNLLPPDTTPTLVQYDTSGQLTDDFTNSVSYLSATFQTPHPLSTLPPVADLSETEMRLLHQLATRTLKEAVAKGTQKISVADIARGFDIPERLKQPSGAFVTLKKEGNLRGCIGAIWPTQPLYQAVIKNAVNAALRDHRFRPVQKSELAGMEVEVSVLSPMKAIDSAQEFQVGEHGILLTKRGRRAVYLPEVAPEQGWDRETTLGYLSRKAGLPTTAWKQGATFEIFTSQKWSAPFDAPESEK